MRVWGDGENEGFLDVIFIVSNLNMKLRYLRFIISTEKTGFGYETMFVS
jgi:hypothetical protein